MAYHLDNDPEDDSADAFDMGDLPIEEDDDGIEPEDNWEDDCPSCGQPLNDNGDCETIGCPESIDDGEDLMDDFDDEDA